QAQERRVISQTRLAEAEAKLRAKQILSLHKGVVSEVLKHPGESVTVGAPVFRVDNPEWLQVTGKLDVGDCWRVRVGAPVRVHVELDGVDLPIERERFAGKIVFIDTKLDHETQMCTVVASVENRDRLIVAGLEAALIITTTPLDRDLRSNTPNLDAAMEGSHARTSN
ncbi:MAG: HlyD family efflux transporter periplasmic adaptor subunit, partial [Acidimicrobiia bacterium]|nr:HlyD family efflux transporter periplasmic adaptor subunit [Acidimicrobiia bacterium]